MTFPLLDPHFHDLSSLINPPSTTDPLFNGSTIPLGTHNFLNQPFLFDTSSMLTYPYFLNFPSNISFCAQTYLQNSSPGAKRPLQDFSNNTLIGSTYSIDTENNDSKKTKLEVNTNTEPSRVLHIRNIAPRAQEYDLTLLVVPFGKIKSMVYAKKTNQALIEMYHDIEATRLFDYYTHFPPYFNGKEMIIQYSKHHGLELKLQNNSIDVSVDAANKMVDEHRQRAKELQSERRILRVVIENFKDYNINHLVILKIFQRFGKVLRIIIFTKNMQCQCLIEMDNSISAHVALLHLNGQDMFTDSCRLRVEFSKNCESLQIQRQNDKCRDYTISPLLEEERIMMESLDSQSKLILNYQSQPLSFQQNLSLLQPQLSGDLLGYPNIYFPFMPSSFDNRISAQSVITHDLNQLIQDSAINALKQDLLLNPPVISTVEDFPIIMVTNINAKKVGTDALFTLFGVYGDVLKVTISSVGFGSALIQMMNDTQAEIACRFLNGIPLYGKNLLATIISKEIIPNTVFNSDLNIQNDIKDFTNTPLHRFKKPNSKNHFNIYPPSSVLHLSNIPLSMAEEDLIALFHQYGFSNSSLKIFHTSRKEKKMALVRMTSLDEAVVALITLHNCKLTDSSHLRVSFSKALI